MFSHGLAEEREDVKLKSSTTAKMPTSLHTDHDNLLNASCAAELPFGWSIDHCSDASLAKPFVEPSMSSSNTN